MPPRKRKSSRETAEVETTDERPTARGVWSGSISFGLVTIPVELYSATRRVDVPTRLLSPDGEPLARQYVCPEDGKVLSGKDIERGFEIEDDKFVPVSDAELEKLAPRRSRDIELRSFVERDAIDPAYFLRSYFVLPAGEQTRAYRLLAETMEASKRVALADFVMRGKAYAVAIFADRGVMRAETLRFADELRQAADLGIPIVRKPEAAKVSAMSKAIAKLETDTLDESELLDDSDEKLLDLARAKAKSGRDVVKVTETNESAAAPEASDEPEEDDRSNVIDLFALIQKRLRAAGGGAAEDGAKAESSKASGPKASSAKAKRSPSKSAAEKKPASSASRKKATAKRGTTRAR